MKNSRIPAFLCIFSLILSLTGCASASYDLAPAETLKAQSYSASADLNGAAMEIEAEYGYMETTSAESVSGTQNDLASRKIIKTANLSFETETYDSFIPALESCITSMGGYIESSEAYGGGISSSRSRSSYITARIPESSYSRFMTDVCEIGTLTYKSESSEDVTLSYVDTESRLKSLKTEYDALIEILDKATSLDDVIQLQSRISEVTYQLESYEAQLRKYDDLIAYCTVHLDVSEVRRVTQNEEVMSFGERISSGLSETFSDIGRQFTDFSVWLIVSLPYILIWGVIITAVVLAIILCVRTVRKKKEQKLINQYLSQIHEKENSNNP